MGLCSRPRTSLTSPPETLSIRLSPGCTDLQVETTSALGGHSQWDSLDLRPGEAVPLTLERWTSRRNVGAGAPESDTP